MDGVELLRRRAFGVVGGHLFVARLAAVGAPMPLVLSGVGVEHDDAAVAVAVADVHLIARDVFPDLCWLPEVLGVVAAVMNAMLADLKKERAGAGELEDLC